MADIEGFSAPGLLEKIPGWLVRQEQYRFTEPVYDLLTTNPESPEEAAKLTLKAALMVLNRQWGNRPLVRKREETMTVGVDHFASYPPSFGLDTVPAGYYEGKFTADGNRGNSNLTYEIFHDEGENPAVEELRSVAKLTGRCVKGEVKVDEVELTTPITSLPFHKVAGAILAWRIAGSSVVNLGWAEREELNKAFGLTKDEVWKDQTGAIVDPPF